MDITYIQELVEELKALRDRALSKILHKGNITMEEYEFNKGRYHALNDVINTLTTRHAID